MQASLDVFSLKSFTKALTCLSRYGDELSIYATPDYLSFSATNSSKSAFCLFKYERQFFARYKLGSPHSDRASNSQEERNVTGQLTVKSLLSILKHRTVEKSVERCEFAIVEGDQISDNADDEDDTLESRFIVRFFCKHGVIKTHRLVLFTPESIMTPGAPDPTNESRLIIGPKALKDLLDHFPIAKGARADPQLVWKFEDRDVVLKSMESSIDSRGKGQLYTEISVSADEFDIYDIAETPTTLAFHLREFNATIAFADSLSLSLEMRFTEPATPLYIEMQGDALDVLFVISTSQIQGVPGSTQRASQSVNGRKREREKSINETPRVKKSVKAAQAVPLDRQPSNLSRSRSMLPPSFIPPNCSFQGQAHHDQDAANLAFNHNLAYKQAEMEPLFLPSSQISVADEEALRAIGLDAEAMYAEQLNDLLDGDGEEVDFSCMPQPPTPIEKMQNLRFNNQMDVDDHDNESLEIVEDHCLTATQESEAVDKTFQPLFED